MQGDTEFHYVPWEAGRANKTRQGIYMQGDICMSTKSTSLVSNVMMAELLRCNTWHSVHSSILLLCHAEDIHLPKSHVVLLFRHLTTSAWHSSTGHVAYRARSALVFRSCAVDGR